MRGTFGATWSPPRPWSAWSAWPRCSALADVTEHVAEKTGCDLRRLADVQELLIAIRLGAGRAG